MSAAFGAHHAAPVAGNPAQQTHTQSGTTVGHFDFDDGGSYSGGSDQGRAHGHGVCTGPKNEGEYAGEWQAGFETSGVYSWPNGSDFAGQWMQGKRHGLGVERRGRWTYSGEWTQGTMGRYGVRHGPGHSVAKYEGTWTTGLQDGYGRETYSDGGTYQGQWMKGARHGYGVRKSTIYSDAATCRQHAPHHRSSLTSIRSVLELDSSQPSAPPPTTDAGGHLLHARPGIVATGKPLQPAVSTQRRRIGFFLTGKCVELDEGGDAPPRMSLQVSRQLQDALRASFSGSAVKNDRDVFDQPDAATPPIDKGSASAASKHKDTTEIDTAAVETYSGEWKNDRRSGHGVSERSDGLRYEGEWLDNCKCGYGVTTFGGGPDHSGGWLEEGKYKNNVLLSPSKKFLLPLRASKVREKIDAAVAAAVRAAQIAAQKSDIANSRMESARSKAELAGQAAAKAFADADRAKLVAKDVEVKERRDAVRDANRQASQPTDHRSDAISPQHHQVVANRNYQQQQQPQHASHSNNLHHHHQQQMHSDDAMMNKVRSRPSPGPEGVHDDANERIVLRNTSSTPRRHQNPSPSSTPSMSSLQRADHSQMNHVGPPQPSRRPARSSVTPTGSTLSVPDTGDQQRRLEPGDRRSLQWSVGDNASWTDVDAEIPADAAATNEGAGATEKPAEGPEVTADHPRLEARPSLRLRRHFDCPDLVLINRNPSAEDVATACTPRAEPVPPPPPQRPLPPSFSSSSSSGPTSASRLPRRRLTLPGIIKYDPPVLSRRRPGSSPSSSTTPVEPLPAEYIAAAAAPAVDERSATPPTTSAPLVDAGFGVRGGRPATEMYLVENCARKRLQEERLSEAEVTAAMEAHHRTAVASILDTPSLDGLDPPRPLAMRYRVQSESLNRRSGRCDLGSMPDLRTVRQLPVLAPIPRNEAMLLCHQKREELQLIFEQQQQRSRHSIVLRLGDFKAWCVRRQLVLFVLALNVALAVTFYKLLYE